MGFSAVHMCRLHGTVVMFRDGQECPVCALRAEHIRKEKHLSDFRVSVLRSVCSSAADIVLDVVLSGELSDAMVSRLYKVVELLNDANESTREE